MENKKQNPRRVWIAAACTRSGWVEETRAPRPAESLVLFGVPVPAKLPAATQGQREAGAPAAASSSRTVPAPSLRVAMRPGM